MRSIRQAMLLSSAGLASLWFCLPATAVNNAFARGHVSATQVPDANTEATVVYNVLLDTGSGVETGEQIAKISAGEDNDNTGSGIARMNPRQGVLSGSTGAHGSALAPDLPGTFQEDGRSTTQLGDVFDIVSGSLPNGTLVEIRFKYQVTTLDSTAASSGTTCTGTNLGTSEAFVTMQASTNGPVQTSYNLVSSSVRKSCDSDDPVRTGVFSTSDQEGDPQNTIPAVFSDEVVFQGTVGFDVNVYGKLDLHANGNHAFADQDAQSGSCGTLRWGFSSDDDIQLISHLVGTSPPPVEILVPGSDLPFLPEVPEDPQTACCSLGGGCLNASPYNCTISEGIVVNACQGDSNLDGYDDACVPPTGTVDCCTAGGACQAGVAASECVAALGVAVNACLGDGNADGKDDACVAPPPELGCCSEGLCELQSIGNCTVGAGYTVPACLGDSNLDGFDDRCVPAPPPVPLAPVLSPLAQGLLALMLVSMGAALEMSLRRARRLRARSD